MRKNKDLFRIGDIMQLFGIGPDSIRYYEKKGLIAPTRDTENNYRLYSLDDIRHIANIRELLKLNFSVKEIREFEKEKSLAKTMALFEQELERTRQEIQELEKIQENIQSKLQLLEQARGREADGAVELQYWEERPVVMISETNIPDNKVALRAVEHIRSEQGNINMIGACDCYTLDLENSNPASSYYRTYNVFLYYPNGKVKCNASLPAGLYLSLTYRGSPKKTKQYMPLLFQYAREHDLKPAGRPIEFDFIDIFETSLEEEYLLEIQLPVVPLAEQSEK